MQNPGLPAEENLSETVFGEMDKNKVWPGYGTVGTAYESKCCCIYVITCMTKDGEITCEEFTSACMRQEDISKLLAVQIIDIFVEDDGK